jgi:hypothetical protein
MIVPHYTYMLFKMLALHGVMTFHGNLKKSYDCDQKAIEYALTTCVPDSSAKVLAAL